MVYQRPQAQRQCMGVQGEHPVMQDQCTCSGSNRMSAARSTVWLLILFICSLAQTEAAMNIKYDTKRDWVSGIVAKGPQGCILAQHNGVLPRHLPRCSNANASEPLTAANSTSSFFDATSTNSSTDAAASNTTATTSPEGNAIPRRKTLQELRQLGWLLAPKMYHHPDEVSQLSDPRAWLEQAPIYNPVTYEVMDLHHDFKWDPAYASVLGSRYFTTRLFDKLGLDKTITTETLYSLAKGDPVDKNGYSTATVYYTAMDAADDPNLGNVYARGRVMLIKFYYFYPFNGCSNQLFGLNIKGKYQGIEYYMCSEGVHEGDWEHISLWVCVDDWDDANPSKAIKRVQYGQHNWNSQYDCDDGQCEFEVDEQGHKRLVAYSSLFSHAMYPKPSPLHVYKKVSAALLMNVDGLYIGDRASQGGAVFLPNENNTRLLPYMYELTTEQRQGEFAWAMFSGSWGGYTVGADEHSVTCFFNNFTQQGPCPRMNPATAYLGYYMKITNDVTTVDQLTWRCLIDTSKPTELGPLTGPLMRDWAYQWEQPAQPPLYATVLGGTVSCPFSGDPKRTAGDDGDEVGFANYHIEGFIAIIISLLFGSGLVFWLALIYTHQNEAHELVEVVMCSLPPGEDMPPPRIMQEYQAIRHLAWMVLALALYGVGMVLGVIGIADIFKALERIYTLDVYSMLQQGFIMVLAIFGCWEVLVVATVLLLRNQRVVRLVCCTFRNPMWRWKAATRVGWRVQLVVACLQVIAINITILLFAFGFAMTMVRIVAGRACNTVVEKLFELTPAQDVCLDLSYVGVDKVLCGDDLTKLCGIWRGLHIQYLAYAGLLLVLSHLLFLAMSVHQYIHLQCLQAMTDTIRGRRPSSSTIPEPLLSHTSKQHPSHAEFHSNPLLTVARTATGNSYTSRKPLTPRGSAPLPKSFGPPTCWDNASQCSTPTKAGTGLSRLGSLVGGPTPFSNGAGMSSSHPLGIMRPQLQLNNLCLAEEGAAGYVEIVSPTQQSPQQGGGERSEYDPRWSVLPLSPVDS